VETSGGLLPTSKTYRLRNKRDVGRNSNDKHPIADLWRVRSNHTVKGIWKDVLKFLSGAFFVTAGASWYLSWFHIAVPLPFSFFGFTTMSPDFLGIRGFIHFVLFLTCFYFGFVKKSAR
jgi:hypothetical protein